MTHETVRLDNMNFQSLTTGMRPRNNTWTDIGEAQVIHTIFGGARVRIVRKKSSIRRALLLAMLAVLAGTAAIWQVWVTAPQSGLQQGAAHEPVLSGAAPAKTSVTQPEPAPLRSVVPEVKNKPAMPPQAGIKNAAIAQKSVPPQPPVKPPEPVAAKPATPQPLPAIQSQPITAAVAPIALPPKPGATVTAPIPGAPPPPLPADGQKQAEPVGEPGK